MTRSTSNSNPTKPVYTIGTQRASRPLVSQEHVRGHLRLLRAFYNLRITIEDCQDRRIPEYVRRMDKDARWRWFVHLAVERFERWVKSLQPVPLEKFITWYVPPVDVWMVWHAYLLNPRWYAEDCERLASLQQLRLLNMFVVGSINIGKVVQQKPSNARVEAWYRETGVPFNPFDSMTASKGTLKELECPRCRTSVYSSFINDGTGFAEKNFSIRCPLPGCRLKITHDNLGVAKFLRDLSEIDGSQENFVAGSLFTPSGKRDARHARLVRDQLMQLDRVKEIKENIGYSLIQLEEAISASLRNCPATSILSAYTTGSPFSVCLVDAVLRQCQFTTQIDDLGWLKSGTFREADKREILGHSITRYHAFLDMASAYPESMFVPTLDVDLVWHTHQLMASRYIIDCEMYVGYHVDHDLSVTESRLSSAFDDTCRVWQTRFQTPYMQCGCPIAEGTDRSSMNKFMRLVRHYLCNRSQLQLTLHPEHLPATHPSTHNALLTFQTVGAGMFARMHHGNGSGKRKGDRSKSPTPPCEPTWNRTESTQVSLHWRHSTMVPVYSENEPLAISS